MLSWRRRRRREKIPTVSSPHLTFCATQLSMGQDRAGQAGRVYWQLSKQIKIDKFLLKRTQYLFMDCHPIKIVINPSSNQFSTPIRSWAGGKCKCLNLSHFYWASEGLVYGWSQLIRFDTFVTVTGGRGTRRRTRKIKVMTSLPPSLSLSLSRRWWYRSAFRVINC